MTDIGKLLDVEEGFDAGEWNNAPAGIEEILEAHQMEVRMLYEALERALSHFAVMGTEQAKCAAEEIEIILSQRS